LVETTSWLVVDRKLVATAECLLPHVKSTRRCTEAVDKYLRRFLDNHEFRSACRYNDPSFTAAAYHSVQSVCPSFRCVCSACNLIFCESVC